MFDTSKSFKNFSNLQKLQLWNTWCSFSNLIFWTIWNITKIFFKDKKLISSLSNSLWSSKSIVGATGRYWLSQWSWRSGQAQNYLFQTLVCLILSIAHSSWNSRWATMHLHDFKVTSMRRARFFWLQSWLHRTPNSDMSTPSTCGLNYPFS